MVHGSRECFASPQIIKILRQMEESLVWVNAEGLNEKRIQERMEWF